MQTSSPLGTRCYCSPRADTKNASRVLKPSSRQQTTRVARSKSNGASEDAPKPSHQNGTSAKSDEQWEDLAFPTYLQSEVDDFCQDWDEALQLEERRQSDASHKDVTIKSRGAVTRDNPVWQAIRKEAAKDAAQEPILSSFLYASVLSHDSFEMALAAILANRLSDPTMMATELIDIFHSVLRGCQEVEQAALADVIAVRERDPACTAYSSALLYYKGYHALQTHRIAHGLWERGQTVLARSLQYRCTQTLAVDIHPAARIGKGVLLDHGTGLVIGETAVVGNNVSILHNVTLGGTGKEVGDRHPKVNDNVLIGASATILGNISIGKGAQVAAGSLVLKNVPPRTMVAGSPAKEVGKVTGNPALKMQHWMKNQLVKESYAEQWEDIVRSGAASSVNRAKEPSTASTPKNGGKDVTTSDSAQTSGRLPAEFGTKDKVPAKGMAPMGPADYADGSQWTAHDGTMQRRERDGNGGKIDHSRNGASDHGYIGGDGAKLSGGVRQEESSIATDLASSTNSAAEVDQQHHDSTSGASRDQPQGLAQSPQQARAEPSNRQNGAEPAGGGGSQQSTPSKPTDSSGVKADGGKDKSASSDLDWWREVTAASKRNDRSSAAAAPPPNSQQQNGASRPSHHYSDGRQNGAVPSSQSAGQNGAAAPSPSASSLGHQQASSSDTASKGAQGANASTSQPTRSSSSFSTSASRAPLGTDPSSSSSSADHGLPGQSQSTGRASSSNGPALSPEEAADKNKKTQEVEDVASKIENQIPSKKETTSSKPGKQKVRSPPEPDIEYWI